MVCESLKLKFAVNYFAGFLVDFIPFPVINSFTTSAAITIAVGQIKVRYQTITTCCQLILVTNFYKKILDLIFQT